MISVLLGSKFISFTFIVITDMFELISSAYFVLPIYPVFFGLFPLFWLFVFSLFSFPTDLKV